MRVFLLLLAGVCLVLAQGQKDLDEANTPHRSAAILRMDEAQLVAVLKDADRSDFEKAKACQRLAVVGGKAAVPALAALLDSPTLSHYARGGLETNPDASADTALRAALTRLEGNLRIGVINSIGRRRDTGALEALAKLRASEDAATAAAAEAALARIRRP